MKTRSEELDGIRGMAILLVIYIHFVASVLDPKSIFGRISIGLHGVDLFFVLSGMLIGGMLLDSQGERGSILKFWSKRAWRILPIYYFSITAFFILDRFFDERYSFTFEPKLPIWSFFTFCQTFFIASQNEFGATGIAPTWSLSVQMQFYLLCPILIKYLPPRKLVAFLVCGIILVPIFRSKGIDLLGYIGGRHTLLFRADTFFIGILLALVLRNQDYCNYLKRESSSLYTILGCLAVGMILMSIRSDYFGNLDYTWITAFYAVFILIVVILKEGPISYLMRTKVLVWFGKISFGLYLFHQTVWGVLFQFCLNKKPSLSSGMDVVVTMLAFIISTMLAWLALQLIELPFAALGKKVWSGVETRPIPETAKT